MRAIHMAAAALLVLVATVLVATSARAAVDGFTDDEGTNLTAEVREAPDETLTFGTVLNTTPNVSIDQIQLSLSPKTGMDVTYYILESELGGATGSVTWLPDGDGTILFRQQPKGASADATPTASFLVTDPSTSGFQGNRSQQGTAGSIGQPTGSSINDLQTGIGSINNLNNPLGPGGSGDVVFDRHIPVPELFPDQPFGQESGAEGEFGGPSIPPSLSFVEESGAEGEFGPSNPQASLDSGHLPEPSTLTIFGLGSLGLALGALRRALRKAA